MSDVRQLFSTPFAFEMADEAIDMRQLRTAIMAEQDRDPAGLRQSNVGSWHSKTDMLHWGGEAAHALARAMATMAERMTVDVKSPEASRYGWEAEMWANVSANGHFNQYHFHPGSFWSAVAYVDDGYAGIDDPSLGGELQLLDPRMPTIRMNAPDLRLREAGGQVQHDEIAMRPRSGLIVLFPSWLQHAVRPFRGEGVRISVSVNLMAVRKAQA